VNLQKLSRHVESVQFLWAQLLECLGEVGPDAVLGVVRAYFGNRWHLVVKMLQNLKDEFPREQGHNRGFFDFAARAVSRVYCPPLLEIVHLLHDSSAEWKNLPLDHDTK
jgi:hypothetical protein